jgi:hypothetical protein
MKNNDYIFEESERLSEWLKDNPNAYSKKIISEMKSLVSALDEYFFENAYITNSLNIAFESEKADVCHVCHTKKDLIKTLSAKIYYSSDRWNYARLHHVKMIVAKIAELDGFSDRLMNNEIRNIRTIEAKRRYIRIDGEKYKIRTDYRRIQKMTRG